MVRGYVHFPFGNVSVQNRAALILLSGWMFFCLFTSSFLILSATLRSKHLILRKRGMAIAFAFVLSGVIGVTVSAVLPILGLRLPPQAINSTALMCVMIFYAMRRYSLFAIAPAQATESVLSAASGSILALDGSANVSFINKSAGRLLGSDSAAIVGKPLNSFLNEETCKLIEEQLLLRGEPITDYETKIKTFSGGERTVILSGVILKDPLGAKIGAVIDMNDITERKKAENEAAGKNAELKKLNDFMIDRELEMIKIKQEIDHLMGDRGGS
jgi:PAS domain S-box-containing protein